MYWPALIVAIVSFWCFVGEALEVHYGATRRHPALLAAGLALLVAALILELTVQTGSPLVSH